MSKQQLDFIEDDTFHTEKSFELYIEKNKHKYDNSYIDTVIAYCEELEMDVEDITEHLSTSLELKIKAEAHHNRQLKEKIRYVDFNKIF